MRRIEVSTSEVKCSEVEWRY